MSTPRKHHYLPQCYLEGFKVGSKVGKKSHIWQIEKRDHQKHYCPAIEDTGCIRDFHTIDQTDRTLDHTSVENFLSKLETEQSNLIRAVQKNRRIEDSQLTALSTFISLMRYRVPSFANFVEQSHRAIVLDAIKIMYDRGVFGPPQELQKLIDEKGIGDAIAVTISNWKILSRMFAMGLSQEEIRLLMECKYHIYLSPEENFFVTSDNPVALYHPNYEKIKPYGVSLAINGIEVTFPLTSDILIRAGHKLEPGTSVATADEVDEFNRRTIISGERYIFAGTVDQNLLCQIARLQDTKAGFVFDNLFHGNGSVYIHRYIPVQ